jgi:hypothetical protein
MLLFYSFAPPFKVLLKKDLLKRSYECIIASFSLFSYISAFRDKSPNDINRPDYPRVQAGNPGIIKFDLPVARINH